MNSAHSIDIAYRGPKLESRERYFWNVTVWDRGGKSYQSAEPAWWEMGLLNKEDWNGKWISWKNPDEDADRAGIRWLWVPGQDAFSVAPKTVVVFHREVEISEKPMQAVLFLVAEGNFIAKVNGKEVDTKRGWHSFDRDDIGQQLVVGKNTIDVEVTVPEPHSPGPESWSENRESGLGGLAEAYPG